MMLQRSTLRNRIVCSLLALLGSSAYGCNRDTLPAYGELMLLLSTDMSVPDSFDSLVIEQITADGKSAERHWVFSAGTAQGLPNTDCGDLRNPDASQLSLPATFVLRSNREETYPLSLRLRACNGRALVFERSFTTQMPAPGQQKMLRTPIHWLCSNWKNRCFGCGEEGAASAQNCFRKQIAMLPNTDACSSDACGEDPSQKFYVAVDLRPSEADTYASGAKRSCFDVTAAFSWNDAATAPVSVPVQWEASLLDPAQSVCVADVDATLLNDPKLNLALVLPPGDLGVCDVDRCLVPLEASTPIGWTRSSGDPQAPVRGNGVALPNAVCHLLDSGQILEVVASTVRPQKGFTMPFCSSSTPSSLPADAAPVGGTTYEFDSANAWLPRERPWPTLQMGLDSDPVSPTDVAISGKAVSVTNRKYAFSEQPLLVSPEFTVAAWISLTDSFEVAAAATPMPIVSDVDSRCASGARLELSSSADGSQVVLEAGIPSPSDGTSDECRLSWSCAEFARMTFAGGFSTPWAMGSWHHVAAERSIGGVTLYLDGVLAPSIPCNTPNTVAPHDHARLYVGSSFAGRDAPVESKPILLDQLALYPSALDQTTLKQLFLYPATVPGPSGLRWGAWGGQGSYATIVKSSAPISSIVTDTDYASAGVFAMLAEPLALKDADGSHHTRDLSDFDEAVIWTTLPADKPFQFSLVAGGGTRQCTWQLFNKPESQGKQYSDALIIDLRRPSWCSDPNCEFDLRNVERLTLGSDWKNGDGQQEYSLRTVAFRKRRAATNAAATRSALIGGTQGPFGACWRSVSYDPRWDVSPVQLTQQPTGQSIAFPKPVENSIASTNAPSPVLPELGLDLPIGSAGLRDLASCASVELAVDWDPASEASAYGGGNSTPQFVLRDERGKTASINLVRPEGLTPVVIAGEVSEIWPPVSSPQDKQREFERIRSHVTRVSIRSDRAITLFDLRCCDLAENCHAL